MRRDSYDRQAWQQMLADKEIDSLGRAKFEIMDEYMVSRENLPVKSLTGEELVADPKSTEEIQDDLLPMVELSDNDIIIYMKMHGFHLTTLDDGTVKWAIWRDMKPLM